MLAGLLLLGAEAAGTTFSVAYAAAADCPTQATFEAAILARSPLARKVEAGAQVRFEVTLQADQRRLRVVLADGTVSDREIADDGCTESMQSMAVIAAMTLDAQARPAPEPVPTPEPAPAPAPEPKPEPQPPPAPAPQREPAAASTQRAHRTWLAIAAAATAEGAAAPTPAWGATLGVELGLRRSGVFAPSVRLSGVWARAAVVETPIGDARFQVALARALLCGLQVGRGPASLRLCGLADAGALLGDGIDARNQRSKNMPWLGLGAGLVGALRLTGSLSLELGGGARGMVVHDSFIFAPGQTVHQVPVFAWNFWAGLSFRAW